MTGWIAIDRGLFGDPFFPREPMSEREAWLWIIAQAAWKDTRHSVGSMLIDVPRGSFLATLREMQTAWLWASFHHVRDFLNRLENAGKISREVIEAHTKTGTNKRARKTQVTVCNYGINQNIGHKEFGTSGTKTGTLKEEKTLNQDLVIVGVVRASQILANCQGEKQAGKKAGNSLEDVQLWRDVMAAAGVSHDPIPKWWKDIWGAIRHCARWRDNLGLSRADIIVVAAANPTMHPKPPIGPKALDGAMSRMAQARHAPPLTIPGEPSRRKPLVGRTALDAVSLGSGFVSVQTAADPPGETVDHQPIGTPALRPVNGHDRAGRIDG